MNLIHVTHLSEHAISGCLHDASSNFKPFPILAIDGIPLNQWIAQNTQIMTGIVDLVPAQGWLYDLDDQTPLTNAWQLLQPKPCDYGPISTVVPLLVCPDDLDLSCSVIMVEQVVTKTEVKWLRFGFAYGQTQDVVTSVVWENPATAPVLSFNLQAFEQAYHRLKDFDRIWNEPLSAD